MFHRSELDEMVQEYNERSRKVMIFSGTDHSVGHYHKKYVHTMK